VKIAACVDDRVEPTLGREPSDAELLKRFVRHRDQDAFQLVVRRHGPMVLQVCQRVLHNRHDAEDAFQATFLILASKAASVGKPDLLGNWLYGVAYRTALKARAGAARRKAHEKQAPPPAPPEPALAVAWREVLLVLDEEIHCLDERHRAALVLCYLEGHTHEEAARRLDCPVGTMSWLLGKALGALRGRLTRRGLMLPAGLPALLLALGRSDGVPQALLEATFRLVPLAVAGKALLGLIPAGVRELADQATRRVVFGKKALAAGLAALLLLLGLGAAAAFEAYSGPPPVAPTSGACGRTLLPSHATEAPAEKLAP
jgi:RNA polymerase sigma factor (sigma-70 family)